MRPHHEDVALWPMDALPEPIRNEEQDEDMGALKLGTLIQPPSLPGKWSVWSGSNETPGAYFVVPANDEAREMGVKYAVVRAITPKGAAKPTLKTLRTDPHRDLG